LLSDLKLTSYNKKTCPLFQAGVLFVLTEGVSRWERRGPFCREASRQYVQLVMDH